MGKFRTWLEDTTGSAGALPNGYGSEENGLHKPQYLRKMTIDSPHARKIFGDLEEKPKKMKKKSPISKSLKPIA